MSLKAGAGMMYEGMLSLSLQTIAALPSPNQLVVINEANDILLNNLMLLEEKHENDDHDEIMQELRRQDMKIRMLMDLLCMLLQQNQLLPAATMVRFSGTELSVPASGQLYPAGSKLQCSLYIDPSLPKPLLLFAESQGVHTEETSAAETTTWLDFTFTGLSLPVQDNIEKLIFRHHRKIVAQQRRQTSTV
jgi:hypothetical protein